MYLSDEVQVMAQQVLTERGCPVQATSEPNSSSSATSLAGSSATDRRTFSSTSSNSMSSSSSRLSRGDEPTTEDADTSSFSLTSLKSAYLQAAANTPNIGSGSNSASAAVHPSSVVAAGAARAPGGVSPAVAAMRSNFLQAFKEDEKRLKEAAAEAAAAAAAEAAAETAAGGISVSSLRSSWLETQRQEAERAAAEAAVAASLSAGKSRGAPVRASSPGMWGAAAGIEQQAGHVPAKAGRRFSAAGPAGNAAVLSTSPASATVTAAATVTVTGQRVLDKTQEVAEMAEKLLRAKRVSNSSPGCAGLAPAASGSVPASVAMGAGAGTGVPVAAPPAVGEAMPIDLDM